MLLLITTQRFLVFHCCRELPRQSGDLQRETIYFGSWCWRSWSMFDSSHCCGKGGWWKIIQLMVVQKRKKGLRSHKYSCQKTLLIPTLFICMCISICMQLEAREQLQCHSSGTIYYACLFVFGRLFESLELA